MFLISRKSVASELVSFPLRTFIVDKASKRRYTESVYEIAD